jgi:hypothetical protein
MLSYKNKLPAFLLCLLSLLNGVSIHSQQLSLSVAGDDQTGFHVDIYNGDQLMVANTEEFSLQLFNLDLSTVANLPQWTGREWSGDEKTITLKRDSYIPEFDANLSVTVNYQVVNGNVIKKTVELFQPSMPDMFYITANRPSCRETTAIRNI